MNNQIKTLTKTIAVLFSISLIMGLSILSSTAHADANGKLVAVIETSMGNITVELNPEKAPKSVANFVQYANNGFYNGTIFHRVIEDFMIQGGGFSILESGKFEKKQTREAIKNEADNGLANDLGTIAMARTNNPNSATAQFFFNVKNNSFLNHSSKTNRGWGYAVFGKVSAGMDVINKIRFTETGAVKPFSKDVPLKPITINNITIK
ncbi:Peptidyl-prolyl cis-trans isomerase PpiB [hydrothermal vent metagenome]|uniref:peptidylprolyl isomerase n=1 Tax=hydrothermal vent metagenome TaxID=652676 RepID=A0A3B0ZYU3_9ZZZZ